MQNRIQLYPALAIILILAGVYFLTFTGIRTNNDEIYLFDTTESLVRNSHFELTYTFHLQPNIGANGIPTDTILYEPLQAIVSAPLFVLGQAIPEIGVMQTLFIFNIFVTSITALMIYAIGLYWGYSWQISSLVALLYGLATCAFPYSITYYREPLTGLFTLMIFFVTYQLQQRWSTGNHISPILIGVLIIALIAVALTKLSNLSILPALIVLLLPTPANLMRWIRQPAGLITVTGFALFAVIMGGLLASVDSVPQRFTLDSLRALFTNTDWHYAFESVIGYQISPGRSLWLYSPILLLAMWGFYLQRKQSGLRMIIVVIVALVAMSATFGAVHRQVWWSGTSWSTRYLLPFVPVMMFGLFPALEKFKTQQNRKAWTLVALLGGIGVALQLLGMAIFVADYGEVLTDNGIDMASTGMWSLQWSQIPQYLALLFDGATINFALAQENTRMLLGVVPFIMLIIISGGTLFWWLNRDNPRLPPFGISAVVTTILVITGAGSLLYSIYDDPRYGGNNDNLVQLIDRLNDEVTSESVLFIQDSEMSLPFMNRFKVDTEVYVLPFAPGEVHNPDVPPPITSDNLVELASYPTIALIDYEAQFYETMWLVMPYGPFNTFTRRPTERYMVENYFPVEEIELSQNTRAIRFFSPTTTGEEDYLAENGQRFGNLLHLEEIILPEGISYTSGEVVPFALTWQPLMAIDRDYSISVQIGDLETQLPITQRDTTPQGQFGYTSRWQTDEIYEDHHGLIIPENTPAGNYCVNIIVYYWEDGGRLPITDSSGGNIGDMLCIAEITVE